ncbi:MAG TPA: helix-turn-helix domain-containing protein [Rectinemataceae bacterium]|nr:helix-turn-helix domain-containing protein [Rectinemataceae bacterium]
MPGNAPALEKGLRIIEHVLAANEPLTLTRIAESLDYSVSEIQRMVAYLSQEGYLLKTGAGAYLPGGRAFALADRSRDSALVARAEGPMRRFARSRAASIHIGVLVERMLHVVFEVEGGGMVRVSVRPGLYDATDSVSGRLLIAYRLPELLDPKESRRIVARGWDRGELACAQGVHVVAVPVALGGEPCAAVLASPYLRSTGSETAPRDGILAGLLEAAAELGAQF